MLRLPQFEYHDPEDLKSATQLLQTFKDEGQECKLIAGGTDLLPNMKHEITVPAHVVSLKNLGLSGIKRDGDVFRIGAMTTLHTIGQDALISHHFPALAEACNRIAGPQLRRMGTLGGNICLDTRCLYINQSYFWRSSLGFCIKKDGTACHVVAGGKNCVAAASNDSVLPLMLYGAAVILASRDQERRVPLEEFYTADGVKNTIIEEHEILTGVEIPVPDASLQVVFDKLTVRKSIDFPLIHLAMAITLEEDGETLRTCRAVVGCLGAKHKHLNLGKKVAGRSLEDPAVPLEVAQRIFNGCRPLTNLATDVAWRRSMLKVLAKRNWQRFKKSSQNS